VDQIGPKIFIVGFNPMEYRNSGLKARWFWGIKFCRTIEAQRWPSPDVASYI